MVDQQKIIKPKKKRKKKKKPQYKGIIFDSNEQIDVYKWCQDLQQNNIIKQFTYQPQSFILSQRQQFRGKFLLGQHKYTADFLITFNQKMFDTFNEVDKKLLFKHTIKGQKVYIDVKPGFNVYSTLSNLSIAQKWVYQRYNIFIYKIEVQDLFNKTFVPQGCRYTPVRKDLKTKYIDFRLLPQFLELF